MASSSSIDPEDRYVLFGADGAAQVVPGGAAFWSLPAEQLDRHGEDWLISEFTCNADWPSWEMHPEADEFVYLLSGAAVMVFDEAGGPREVPLEGRAAVVVPRGVWHTAKVSAPSRMLFVTRGRGTQHRPACIDDRAFVHARQIAAPPARVFRAMAEPERLARWWGPNGFRSSFDVFDFRPGGAWRFTLHGPDGSDYPNENRFVTIDEPQRVVVEHLSDEGHHFVLTITFEAHAGGTRVGWQQVFDTAEHRAQIAAFVEKANEQNLDRLAAEVARMAG